MDWGFANKKSMVAVADVSPTGKRTSRRYPTKDAAEKAMKEYARKHRVSPSDFFVGKIRG